jgi:hypothetical protein
MESLYRLLVAQRMPILVKVGRIVLAAARVMTSAFADRSEAREARRHSFASLTVITRALRSWGIEVFMAHCEVT